jgi:hypothetical protein
MAGIEIAVGVISLIATTIEIISKASQIYEAVEDKEGIPKDLRKIFEKIPKIEEVLKSAKAEYDQGQLNNIDKKTWVDAKAEIEACKKLCQDLHDLISAACPERDSGKARRLWKGTQTVLGGKRKEAESLLRGIWEHLDVLATKHIINNTGLLRDIKSVLDELAKEEGFTASHSGSGDIVRGDKTTNTNSGSGHFFDRPSGTINFGK